MTINAFDIKIDPNNNDILYLATEAGIYKSANKGMTWIQSFNGLNKFYPFDLNISPSDSKVFYTTGRKGIHKSTDSGKSWKYLWEIGVGYNINIDPTNPDIVYVAQSTNFEGSNLWRTTDGGKYWEIKQTSIGADFLEFDPQNSNIIYSNSFEGKLIKSSYRGEIWESINTPASPTSILISKENSAVIYIGTKAGVYKTYDGGINWTSLGLTGDNSRIILSFAPVDENIIYASIYGRGVFKTIDGGTNWEEKNNGLANTLIGGIIPDPKQIGRLFLNTLSGLYVSSNGGDEWNKFRPEDLPNLYYPLGIDTTGNGKIFAVRNNEPGIYVLDSIYSDPSFAENNSSPQNFMLYQNYPNPFNPTTTINYELPQSGKVTLKLFDILGNEVKTLVNEQKEMGNYLVQFSASGGLACGMYVYQLRVNDYVSAKKMLLVK